MTIVADEFAGFARRLLDVLVAGRLRRKGWGGSSLGVDLSALSVS
jgi:hypothetical protein